MRHLNSFLLNQRNKDPSDLLKNLFKLLGLPYDGDLKAFHELSQKYFLRPKGRERWEIDTSIFDNKFKDVKEIIQKLGLIGEIQPHLKNYDTIFVHGSIYTNLRARLKFLDNLWVKGIRAKNIVVVSSDRPFSEIENPSDMINPEKSVFEFRPGWEPPRAPLPQTLPRNQNEMSQLMWDQMITQEELRKKSVEFLTIKKTIDKNTGTLIRYANTQDTIEVWLDQCSNPGTILAISNNPYIYYQHVKLRNALYKKNPQIFNDGDFHFETVGFEASPNTPLIIYLDTIARWLDTDFELLSISYSLKLDSRSRGNDAS